ncbi:hypothetical protein [Streptomyces synnematoformans]|uniref:Uncharacterized protein n=1 Tax=Streptomyces synnematoformans TaxID=415721 RepID=A0ABP5K3T8_9ACTN
MSGGAADPADIPYAFEYRIPDEFVQLPGTVTADGWVEAMARLLPGGDEEYQEFAGEQMRKYLPWVFSHEDIGFALAMCLGTEEVDGDDRLSAGLLTVSGQVTRHRDPLFIAEALYRAKETKFFTGEEGLQDLDFEAGKGVQGRQDMVLAVKLPCGPGVMSTSLRSLTLKDTDRPEGNVFPLASLQLIVPAPSDYCVYVTLTTPSVYLLDSYSERLAHIGRTFSFDVQEAESETAELR